MSRIRGGLNFSQIRVHEQPLFTHQEAVHILLPLSEEAARKVLRLVDLLEELDDVQTVYGNFDISDEVMAALKRRLRQSQGHS